MILSAAPALHGSLPALDVALAGPGTPEAVASFVNDVAPADVLSAVQHCLAPEARDVALRLVRAKLKPGRKLTAEYDVVLPAAVGRRIFVTWVAPGGTAPGPAADAETEARRRGVLAPFRRSWVASDDRRMSMSVAPVDGAFPQLVRLNDPDHLVDVLRETRAVSDHDDLAPGDVTVQTVRYRPGQRHVLRVGGGPDGAAWFAKVYRDDTGRRAVAAAAGTATALRSAGDGAAPASVCAGTYVERDRVALWPEVAGVSLAEVITLSGPAAADVVRATGSALRLIHDAFPPEGLPACADADAQAGETLRTAQVVDALLPAAGSQLRRHVGRGLEVLSGLPVERPTATHGDFKCDNVVVGGSGVHLLDFDRLGRGDPAADIGKFLADLRWWTGGAGPTTARLHEAFLSGYGPAGAARPARARVYDALSQLRMAARRVPLQDPDWAHRVTAAVGVAAATLDEEWSA